MYFLPKVLDGTLVSVAACYDNEYGYATRLADMTALLYKAAHIEMGSAQKAAVD